MSKKKASLDKDVQRAAAILEEHFATLSKAEEKKARRELHLLASSVARRVRRSEGWAAL